MAYHDTCDLELAKYSGPMYCVCKVATNFDDAGDWKDEIWSVSARGEREMDEADFDTLEEAVDYAMSYPKKAIYEILKRDEREYLTFNIEHDTWEDGDRESDGCVMQIHFRRTDWVRKVED